MADDPDALWKPGSARDLEFDRLEPHPFVLPGEPARTDSATDRADGTVATAGGERREERGPRDPIDGAGTSRARRPVAAMAVVVAMAVVGVAVVAMSGGAPSGRIAAPLPTSAPPTFPVGDVGGDVVIADPARAVGLAPSTCSTVRLPSSVPVRWSVDIDDVWNLAGPIAAGAGGVAALTVDTSRSDSAVTLHMFESIDGSQRWRRTTDELRPGSELVAVIAGVVIVESSAGDDAETKVLAAFDTDTGSPAWSQTILPGTDYLIDRVSETIVVEDPGGGDDEVGVVLVLDAAGGIVTGNVGRFVALDADRRLVTRVGSKFLATAGADSGSDLIGTASADVAVTTFGSGLLVADGESGGLRLVDTDTEGERIERSVRLVGSARVDPPSGITSLSALDESAVVVTGRGAVHGAVFDEADLRVRWRVDGVLSLTAPSDRGATLLVFSDGGALQRLVDAATGRKFLDVPTVGGALSLDDLFSNGVVVRGGSGTAAVRSAYDLDGELMWRLPRWGSLAVGDGVVYDTRRAVGTATEAPSISVSIVAFGPVAQSPLACDQRPTDDGGS